MSARHVIPLVILVVGAMFPWAFAEPSLSLDRQSYTYGDTVRITGTVQYEQDSFVIVQIRSSSDIVGLSQIMPAKSGAFSATFEAEGPKWQQPGEYTAMVSYMGKTSEVTFQFSMPKEEQDKTAEEPKPAKPKVTIAGFPDPAVSPQHYIYRYSSEPEFRRWFDSTFPGFSVQEVVGYKPTHIKGFPDPAESPQYYIDRYNNEAAFREWFDSQFPHNTIHEIVGATEEAKSIAPGWVRQYARWWSDGSIGDSQFADSISELIRQGVIRIDGSIAISEGGASEMPEWFKFSARWYSEGQITEEEFLSGIEYLIGQRIIVV